MVFQLKDGKLCFDDHLLDCIKHQKKIEIQSMLEGYNPSELRDSTGSTLLHLSAKWGRDIATQCLIKLGCDVNAKDNNGITPLILAVGVCEKTVKILIDARSDIYVSMGRVGSLLRNVIRPCRGFHDGRVDYPTIGLRCQNILDIFLQKIKDDFHNDTQAMAKLLFEAKCPLYHVIRIIKNPEVTRYFLNHGCPVDAPDSRCGYTPLYFSVGLRNVATTNVLLEYGADANLKDFKFLRTLYNPSNQLIYEEETFKIYTDIVEVLLLYGADIQNMFTKLIEFFDHSTVVRSELVKLIIAHLALLTARGQEINEDIRAKVNSYPISDLYESYQGQLKKTESIVVYESMTMFKLITASDQKLTRYAANADFISKFTIVSHSSPHSFWYYNKYLRKRIARAINTLEFQRKVSQVIFRIIGTEQHLIVDKILSLLSIKDCHCLLLV